MIDGISNFSTMVFPRTSRIETAPEYQHLALHVESDDYFPYLSTLLGFIEEMLSSGERSAELARIQLAAVRAARKDLTYLHDHYRIEPR